MERYVGIIITYILRYLRFRFFLDHVSFSKLDSRNLVKTWQFERMECVNVRNRIESSAVKERRGRDTENFANSSQETNE